MSKQTEISPLAVHYEDGNLFDNLQIDLKSSYKKQDIWLESQVMQRDTIKKPIFVNYTKFLLFFGLKKTGIWDMMISTGIVNQWFEEFNNYWVNVLRGRPITLFDFHQLRFHYRRNAQKRTELSWEDNVEHLNNWQQPNEIYLTFNYVMKYALQPFRSRLLSQLIKKNRRILEYGCSLAPMYRTYRKYYNHVPSRWILADIPNFPFHYARYTYAKDAEVEQLVTITEDLFDDPLRDIKGDFDVIIIQEVFEHLHSSRHIAEYLLHRLKKGGLFYFDYIKSDAHGLDTPMGLAERRATIDFLLENLEIIHGNCRDGDIIGKCLGRKK